MVIAGALLAAVVALVLGLLLAKYREHLLRHAESGVLDDPVRLAGEDIRAGQHRRLRLVGTQSFAGITLGGGWARYTIYAFAAVLAFMRAWGTHRYFNSHLGRLAFAVRDNELRVEYMGASVRRLIHLNYVISAAHGGNRAAR